MVDGNMSSVFKKRQRALGQLLKCDFSFAALLDAGERLLDWNDCATLDGPLNEVCFSLWNRLQDLKDSAEEAGSSGEPYPVQFAKEQWLDLIAAYAGTALRRIQAGELLMESEGVTAKFLEEVRAVREHLRVI